MGKGSPTMGERMRVSKKRITGQLIQWKGKYGWIRPTEPVQHPDAEKRSGKIYVGVEDIEGPELTNKCMVSFICYADDDGLGAMHCKAAPHLQRPGPASNDGGVIRTIGKKGGGLMTKGNGKVLGKAGGKNGGKAAGKGPMGKDASLQPRAKAKTAAKRKAKAGVKTELDEVEDGEAPKELKERLPPPPPDQSARERIMKKRLIGKLIKWRGEIGWIKPNEKIDHPEAVKHRKGLFLHEIDVKPGHEMFQGAQVSFFVYVDAEGLGAEQVMITKEQPVNEIVPLSKGTTGKGKGKDKGKGKGKGPGNLVTKLTMVQKTKLKRKKGKRGGDKGEKSEQGEKTKGGPDLPRERITVMPVTGQVAEWKGKFGWLKTSKPFEHEMASKHDGRIYLHEKDILAGAPLSVGQTLEFYVYADESGLGAEEAMVSSTTST